MFGGYSGGAVLFLLPVVCRQGNFSARTGNKCFFLSSDEPSCHLPSAESEFRHFPSLQTTATAVFTMIEPAFDEFHFVIDKRALGVRACNRRRESFV